MIDRAAAVRPGPQVRRHSFSYSSPAQFGTAQPEFERDIRATLLDWNLQGIFEKIVRTELILARRG